jgi:hypothetical protein
MSYPDAFKSADPLLNVPTTDVIAVALDTPKVAVVAQAVPPVTSELPNWH